MDIARTMPFFFSPRRLLVVEIISSKSREKLSTGKEKSIPDMEDMTEDEQKILTEYFASPSPRTIMLVLFSGKIQKSKPLYKLFSSLPSSTVFVRELKVLKNKNLETWANERLEVMGKHASQEAIDRLIDMTGNNLQRLDNELKKLATYIGEKKFVELSDVDELSSTVKEFEKWELADSLEKADFGECLRILRKRFQESGKPELNVLAGLTSFLRDSLLARAGLRERKDRRKIFNELRPWITEKMGDFYRKKQNRFFAAVEGISQKELNRLIAELEDMDVKIKTTDCDPRALFESFIYEYCRLREKSRPIWTGPN
jgi:DNA polymerase-3 subunit delta